MPSPFPGMDPYLESPDIWPDFHDRLATEISSHLNATLPSPYYARLEMRPEVGIVSESGVGRRIVPDVAVVQSLGAPAPAEVAVIDSPRTIVSQSFEIAISDEPIRHAFVEIRDPSRGHGLVTLIEIVSPSNKQPGPDRRAYLRKQREVLESEASLVELDLLRSGERLIVYREVEAFVQQVDPSPDYLALVNRAWRRQEGAMAFQVFPIRLTEPLPCVGVPLREKEPEAPLDLQYLFHRVYDAGPYRRGAIDYGRPPQIALPEPLEAWRQQRLAAAGVG